MGQVLVLPVWIGDMEILLLLAKMMRKEQLRLVFQSFIIKCIQPLKGALSSTGQVFSQSLTLRKGTVQFFFSLPDSGRLDKKRTHSWNLFKLVYKLIPRHII